MKNPMLLSLSVAIAALAIIGCDQDDDPISPTPDERTGTIAGMVYLIDSNRYADNHSGVTVHIEGTSHAATSDSAGRWFINGVPPGVYTIELSKPGYTREYLIRGQFVGRDTLFVGVFNLRMLLPERIDGLSVSVRAATGTAPAVLRIDGSLTPAFSGRAVTIMLGTSPTVSMLSGTYRFSWLLYTGPLGRIAGETDVAGLRRYGFDPGSTAYVVAYPGGATKDYDWVADRYYFKDLVDAPSPVASVVLQ